jgi:hypothetical protein
VDTAALRETEKEIARLQAEVSRRAWPLRFCRYACWRLTVVLALDQTENYINENQAEANELMAEYWRLRSQVGQCAGPSTSTRLSIHL